MLKAKGDKKIHLEDIAVMRPILICFFLVGYHAFAPWAGVWQMPKAIDGEDVAAYFWLDKFMYSFMLEAFVFISGYLFAYQKYFLHKKLTLKIIVHGKFKRLMLPCIVFSLLYSLISYDFSSFETSRYLYDIICGLGHLWFLPMLFICFILVYYIDKIRIKYWLKLSLLLTLSIIIYGHEYEIPFRLGYVCYYLFYFYLAFGIFANRETIIERYALTNKVWLCTFSYFVTFILLTLFAGYEINSIDRSILLYVQKFVLYISRAIYSTLGLFSFYLLVNKYLNKRKAPSKLLIGLNPLCMGIFLIHNFIFRIIYNKTTILPELFGTLYLPWIAYVAALLGSVLLTMVLRKTKIGRALC